MKDITEDKKNTSLRLDKKKLKKLKIIAIKEDTSVQKILEGLVDQFLDSRKKLKSN